MPVFGHSGFVYPSVVDFPEVFQCGRRIVGKLVKLGVPVMVVAGLGVFGWLYPESSGNTDEAGRAAGAVMDAPDRAIDSARAGDRYRSEKEDNFVNIRCDFYVQRKRSGDAGCSRNGRAEAVCNRMAFVRDYLVVPLSDYPPAASDLSAGPVGFGGSMTAELTGVIKSDSVSRVRFDS